jgi:hypothetical protein
MIHLCSSAIKTGAIKGQKGSQPLVHSLLLREDDVYVAGRRFHGDLGEYSYVSMMQLHSLEYMLSRSQKLSYYILLFHAGMGHFGELARSKTIGAPISKTNEEGRQQTYNLGKIWIGEEYDIAEMNEKERNIETVT